MKFNPESTIIVEGNEIVAKNDIYNSTYTGGVYVSGENNFGSEIIGNSSTNPSFFEFMDAHTKSTFGDDISYHIFRVASGQLDFNNLASNYLDIDLQVASATLNFNNVDFQNSNIYGVGNAIAVTGANTTTTFDGTISDAVTTLTDATLKFNSNTFENSDLIATSGNVDLSNDTVQEYLFNKLTSSADVKYVIDIDMTDTDNVKSDLFNVGMGSNGTITIDTLNLLTKLSTTDDRNFNFKTSSDVYSVIENFDVATAGVINVNGKGALGESSTIDGKNYSLFKLDDSTTLNLNNVKITGAHDVVTGTGTGAVINLKNAELSNNTNGITTAGSVNVENSLLKNNGNGIAVTSATSEITLNAQSGDVVIQDKLSGVAGAKLNVNDGKVSFGETVSDLDIFIDNATASLSRENLFDGNNLTVSSLSAFNLVNKSVGTMSLNEITLSDNLNVTVDVDLANGIIDKISGNVIGTPTGNINIDKFNYMSDSLRDRFSLNVYR